MEQLQYIVEDSILAELLGVQNFSNKEAAVLELVKNAFDAGAPSITIQIFKNHMSLVDSGSGMDSENIKLNWMHIGKSDKGYEIIDDNGETRILAGSKGVGRFALARLGQDVVLKSQKLGKKAVVWKTDWNKSTLEEVDEQFATGTEIVIKNLRDKWTEKSVVKLSDYFGRTYCDDFMKISLYFENKEIPIKKYFENPEIGINYSTKIDLNYYADKKVLVCDMASDEFQDEAQKYCKVIDIHNFSCEVNILEDLRNETFDDEITDLEECLEELGDFKANLYFGIERVIAGDENRFLYKRKNLEKMFSAGIILYRNSFSISSYEGKKDWLGLGKRSRKSPAAATHPTGTWRVRENQISGVVKIDKKRNKNLQDLSNRQGLDENISYDLFVKIILIGLSEFERYRQSIIREINKKNTVKMEKRFLVSDRVVKNPEEIKKLTKKEEGELITEIRGFQKEHEAFKKSIEDTEKRYKYDVRILNVLATSGLKATSIAHELKNDRNKLEGTYTCIVDALKEYELWDTLNEPEKTQYAHLNVPELLYKNKETGSKLIQFMDIMLGEVEKRQFFAKEYSIKKLIDRLKRNWEKDYSWVNIYVDVDEDIRFVVPQDVVDVIFDNLILNSIQQNEDSDDLNIQIAVTEKFGMLNVEYLDDGIGLPEKYKNNPMKILEPHETSRKKGHGLGMWIVNNTLNLSGGEVIDISTMNGFRIIFTIGGKL